MPEQPLGPTPPRNNIICRYVHARQRYVDVAFSGKLVIFSQRWTVCLLCRDLFVDERQARGERAGGDLLQFVLTGRRSFHCRARTLPGHATNDGNGRRRTTQQDRTGPAAGQRHR